MNINNDNNGEVLKISVRSQLKALRSSIFMTFLVLAFLFYLGFEPLTVKVFLIGWGLYVVPSAILHADYYKQNTTSEYLILPDKLVIKQGSLHREYYASDMVGITIYKSASLDRGGIPILGIEDYHYAQIVMSNNEQIKLTCLLTNNIDHQVSQLNGVPKFRKKTVFCATWL